MHGQSCRGVAVDCVRFVVAILDELYRIDGAEPVPVLPPDTSWHHPRGAMRVARLIARRYPNRELAGDEVTVEPGDILIMRPSPAVESPGHIAIVGPRRGTIWHANPGAGVGEAGIGETKNLIHVWRTEGKDKWLR